MIDSSRRALVAVTVLALAGIGSSGCTLTPRSPGPPKAAAAPPFELPSHHGGRVSLKQLLAEGRPAVVMFYRGHW